MVSSFTPCFNYLTGSSGNGSSPTAECCNSLKNLMSDSMDCTCLIVTGNVPVSIPFISRALAISLPQMCKNSVPLQCNATGITLPSPGPALFAPTQAPIAHAPHAHSPKASKATAAAAAPAETPHDITPAAPPEVSLTPTANPGIRPVLTPNSASNTSIVSLSSLLLLLVGTMVLKFF
ncbi:Bifunctional inhibitor/lipid-transfer protein/seed storage 2S albumin superfamily protein [Abeliophyllum distichum]|uniref:Bifunctional inhibitor/lipid-transfer protein/seed storage 2S albumin superfamily protein n=1 Tax=Abeliophyllum distichum TaxID=126358 RepID=A0ABD1TDC5_9LAMI